MQGFCNNADAHVVTEGGLRAASPALEMIVYLLTRLCELCSES